MFKSVQWVVTLLLTTFFSWYCQGQVNSFIEQQLFSPQEIALYAPDQALEFYRQRDFREAWIKKNRLNPDAKKLISELQSADLEGLNPMDYHLEAISVIQAMPGRSRRSLPNLAQLDILLTDAYLIYAKHLYLGKVCPDDVNQQWHVPCREPEINFPNYLTQALLENEVPESLIQLKPSHPGYQRLKQALAHYRQLYDRGKEIAPIQNADGTIDMRVVQKKLIQLGDLESKDWDQLTEAIIRFKKRHGLAGDSNIDSATISWMNASLEASIQTIASNLERWRWLPEIAGPRYVLVNIADFNLQIMEDENVIFSRPVIIGTPFHATPSMAAEITKIVLNPYWVLPSSVVKEVLLKQDPVSYLKSNNIQVLDYQERKIPYHKIDWKHQKPASFPYMLRQLPGPFNALGEIKFVMPNPYAIYIHDTPGKELFEQSDRTFSRGCIRVKDPFDLAAVLLEDNPQWDLLKLKQVASENDLPTDIDLSPKIPVYILYWTTWVDTGQVLQFRTDVYGRDQALIAALAFSLE